ncbi:MAG TPA: TIGR00730 family Rossman fold protein [Opitutae bacterium]|nr:TIGR00730 family Rossman fold protein [Opitutae bacterium]|tara:strand:+ start:113 stop:697 length:585 start_codon:yes stop_codon:yes gene_type:complete
MKRVVVFCGSALGAAPVYGDCAEALGKILAGRGIGLVYGGGHVGLMGKVADACLNAGGEVWGVMPEHLVKKEIAHKGLTHFDVVDSMHARKARMAELADGFIALPGGWGTMEELMEALTWMQLGIHMKVCGLLNVHGFFTQLHEFFKHMVAEGFLSGEQLDLLVIEDNLESLMDRFAAYKPRLYDKWASKPPAP